MAIPTTVGGSSGCPSTGTASTAVTGTNRSIAPAMEFITTIHANAANPETVVGRGRPCSVASGSRRSRP
jgi:hypothetical protein